MKFLEPTRITSPRGPDANAEATASPASAASASADAIASGLRERPPTRRARSASSSVPSTVSARIAAGTAPARMTVGSTIDNPRKMYSPSPPAPTAAAIVAVPTPITAATRIPATIDGVASGSSTCHSSCRGVIPSAVPASTRTRSTPRSPATVVLMIGSSA